MAAWEQLLIRTADIDCPRLLSCWRWLLKKDFQPIVMTMFGDWFLLDVDGSVYFLDLVSGQLSKAADTGEEFNQVMGHPERLDEWFLAGLVEFLVDCGMVLKPGQCYGFKVPPILGGRLELENIEPTDIFVHQSLMSQIHQQARHLPEGTKIHRFLIDDQEP